MPVNISLNDSLLPEHLSSIDLYKSFDIDCILFRPGSIIFITFSTTSISLLLPLSILILHHGLQEWWQKRSTSSAVMMSHSDSFTYHMVIMELIGLFGRILCFGGIFREDLNILLVGSFLYFVTGYGQTFFHSLTCVERYLAVVHPIMYLSLRDKRGIRIRNIIIECVWPVCFALTSLLMVKITIVDLCLLMFSSTIISFCSLSVLCVLIHPRPGEKGWKKDRVDPTKLRAFYTILAILGVLLIRFAWNLAWTFIFATKSGTSCVIVTCSDWLFLPSSLVLPLLFLHRTGKLRRS